METKEQRQKERHAFTEGLMLGLTIGIVVMAGVFSYIIGKII